MRQKIAECLLGLEIKTLGRVALLNKETLGTASIAPPGDCRSAGSNILEDTLVFVANCGRCFELLTNQETTFLLEVASLRELFVEYALEPDCMLTLQCVDTNGEAGLPAIVNNVIEYWQRHSEQTEYLLGFELMNFHGAAILSVCVETDEAEVLGHKEFISRMDGTKMHYGNVIQFSYN